MVSSNKKYIDTKLKDMILKIDRMQKELQNHKQKYIASSTKVPSLEYDIIKNSIKDVDKELYILKSELLSIIAVGDIFDDLDNHLKEETEMLNRMDNTPTIQMIEEVK